MRGQDLIEQQLQAVSLTGLRQPEQRKKVRELENIADYPDETKRAELIAAGHGNPLLLEWLNQLVGEIAPDAVDRLSAAIKQKQEEFIEKYVIRQLLALGGAEFEKFLSWLAIFRLPVLRVGVQSIGEKAGLPHWESLLPRAVQLTLVEHDQARQSFQVTPLLRAELLAQFKDQQPGHAAALAYYELRGTDQETIDPILTEEWIFHALGCGQEDVAAKQGGRLVSHLRKNLAYLESKRVGEWILAEKKAPLAGGDDAFLLNELGFTIDDLGEHRQAIDYYEQALKIDRAVFGEQHPERGDSAE